MPKKKKTYSLLSISDQAACYEKYGSSVSSSLWDTLDGQGKLSYPMRHKQAVGHHLKNAQTYWKEAHILMVTSLMIPKIYGQLPVHPTNK